MTTAIVIQKHFLPYLPNSERPSGAAGNSCYDCPVHNFDCWSRKTRFENIQFSQNRRSHPHNYFQIGAAGLLLTEELTWSWAVGGPDSLR